MAEGPFVEKKAFVTLFFIAILTYVLTKSYLGPAITLRGHGARIGKSGFVRIDDYVGIYVTEIWYYIGHEFEKGMSWC